MNKLIALALISGSVVAADIDKRPPSFEFKNSLASFVDIKKAYYDINYDIENKSANVVAHLEIESIEEGHPIFDSIQEPTSVRVDGQEVGATLTPTPDKRTMVRVLNQKVSPGLHLIEIELPLKEYFVWTDLGMANAFFMGDLNDREYMERYFPTNFLYDRFPITQNFNFGSSKNQVLYTNGKVTKKSDSEYTVEYDSRYNNSCPYFQTVPAGAYAERRFDFKSMNGKIIPVLIYAEKVFKDSDFDRWQKSTVTILNELEKDYGAFLHPTLTIFMTRGSGGMEYAGALSAGETSLAHELFHSYFARGVMPSEGNSGWIDEALARWRDNGYQRLEKFDGRSNIAALGTYNRLTDRRSYAYGSQVMAYFDGKFKAKGGLKPFLRQLVKDKAFDPISTPDFINAMNKYYGVDNSEDFKKFVMDNGTNKSVVEKIHLHDQPSREEMLEALKRAVQ